MGFFDLAKDSLVNLATADVLRERLELAFQQGLALEKENALLKEQNAVLRFQVEQQKQKVEAQSVELERIRQLHEEAIRLREGVEFRRGLRTGGAWMAFCPICHSPVSIFGEVIACASSTCCWNPHTSAHTLASIMHTLS